MSNPMDDLYGNLFGDSVSGVQERAAAAKGHCPNARICTDRADLAGWFKSFAIAAGATKRSTAESK